MTLMFDHRVENREKLPHRRDQRDLGWFARVAQPTIKDTQHRVIAGGAQRRHVDGRPDGGTPTPDVALAALLTTVAIKRGDADQRGDGAAIQLSEFRQLAE